MLKNKDVYPVNIGVSGYWDILSPEDLTRYDIAMDFAQVYISASKERAKGVISKLVTDHFAHEALRYLCAYMPQALSQRSGSIYSPLPEEKVRGITIAATPTNEPY